MIVCLDAVFHVVNILSVYLQEKTITYSRARTCTKSILATLTEYRSDEKFASLWKVATEKQTQLDLEPPTLPRHRRIPRRIDDGIADNEQYSSIEAYFRRSYYMLDILITEIQERFSENTFSVLSSVESLLLDAFSCSEPKEEHLKRTLTFYSDDFVPEKLKSEIIVLYGFVKSVSPPCSRQDSEERSVDDLITLFLEHSCHLMLPEVTKLMKLYVIIPVSTANAERSFSVLRRTKNWLRSTMCQNRLSALVLCNIEKEVTNSLSLDDLLDQFCNLKDRRIPLK